MIPYSGCVHTILLNIHPFSPSSCGSLRSELDSFRQCLLHHQGVRWCTCTPRRSFPNPGDPRGSQHLPGFCACAGCSSSRTCRYNSTVRDCYFQHCGLGGERWNWMKLKQCWVSEVETNNYTRKHNNAADILLDLNFSMNMNWGLPWATSNFAGWSPIGSYVFVRAYVATFFLAALPWKRTRKDRSHREWLTLKSGWCQTRYALDVSVNPLCPW